MIDIGALLLDVFEEAPPPWSVDVLSNNGIIISDRKSRAVLMDAGAGEVEILLSNEALIALVTTINALYGAEL